MKNPPDHIESVTYEDEEIISRGKMRWQIIFLKGDQVGKLSVPAETLDSNKLASVDVRFAPLHSLSRLKFQQSLSQIIYSFTRKLHISSIVRK